MFKGIEDTDYFDLLLDGAKVKIMEDRNIFKPVYDLIRDYCEERKLFISNVNIILRMDDEPSSIIIYCENPFKHATIMANHMDKILGHFVRMITKKAHEQFILEYDCRIVAEVNNIEVEKGISIFEMVNPIIKGKLHYIPYEIELIDICKKLYLPQYAEEWKDIYRIFTIMKEKEERDRVARNTKKTDELRKTLGGAEECRPCKKKISMNITMLRIDLLLGLLADTTKKYIMVGPWAYNLMTSTDTLIIHRDKLQFITQNDIKDDMIFINETINKNKDLYLFYKEHNMNIPKDFRLRRYTIYLRFPDGNKDKPIADIYNSAQFEPIPYIKKIIINNGIKYKFYIGNYFVMLRFFYIYIWAINVINRLIKKENPVINEIITDIVDMIYGLDNIWSYKFGTNYIGKHIDYTIADKLENLKSKFIPYIPYLAKKIGKFRALY